MFAHHIRRKRWPTRLYYGEALRGKFLAESSKNMVGHDSRDHASQFISHKLGRPCPRRWKGCPVRLERPSVRVNNADAPQVWSANNSRRVTEVRSSPSVYWHRADRRFLPSTGRLACHLSWLDARPTTSYGLENQSIFVACANVVITYWVLPRFKENYLSSSRCPCTSTHSALCLESCRAPRML